MAFSEAARLEGETGSAKDRAKCISAIAWCLRPDRDEEGGDWAQAAAVFGEAAAQAQ